MNKLKKKLTGKGGTAAYALAALTMAIVPESCFISHKLCAEWPDTTTVILYRIIICAALFFTVNIIYCCYQKSRKKVSITDDNYSIQIEYGDLLNKPNGKVVINFDECFTVNTGDAPSDIKPESLCGQYLQKHQMCNMQELIEKAGVKPEGERSLHNNRPRYKSGTLVPNGNYLLMAFAKLDEHGLAHLTYDEYLDCLNTLWEQLDLYHGTTDVYVPILGSGIVRLNLTQQQLLDTMICSYKLSPKKMKKPNTLHIVCKPREGFSLDDVFGIY